MNASYYDRHLRNPRSKQFYNSSAWKRCRKNQLAYFPWCQRCDNGTPAAHVHHIAPIDTPDGWERRLDPENLLSLCVPCHNAVESEARSGGFVPSERGIYVPDPNDDRFYFDAEKADRAVRFIERFCWHFEGRWAGENLKLLEWEKVFVRTLYGWLWRDSGRRRFTESFLLSAKGAGKTPLLAGIGEFELFDGGEAAAHVVSMATDYKQAALTFNWAKKSIAQDRHLDRLCVITQYEIRARRDCLWNTFSGTSIAKSGFRPSCILADEAHEWPNGDAFESVTANLFKRDQPIVIVATNAGPNKNCYAYTLYEQAKEILAGKSERTDLLPVIFEAPESMPWDGEEAAIAANPSIPDVVTFDSIQPKIMVARKNPVAKARYERLHLSRWKSAGINRWLNIADWDALTADFSDQRVENFALYIGLDLSEGDDLCSAALAYATPEKTYVGWRHWMPRSTAEKYEDRGYLKWGEAGDVKLLDDLTISPKVRREIADEILELSPHRVCYDPYRADECIARLVAAGIECIAIRQGFGVSPGCAELERQMKEKSIVIAPNEVSRAAAEKVEIKSDQRGNKWPVKPGDKGAYAGTRSIKIDPITALVTALVEARKHEWPAVQKKWTGGVWSV